MSVADTLKDILAKVDKLGDDEKWAALAQVKELQAKLTPKLDSKLTGMYSQYDKAGKHWYAPNKVTTSVRCHHRSLQYAEHTHPCRVPPTFRCLTNCCPLASPDCGSLRRMARRRSRRSRSACVTASLPRVRSPRSSRSRCLRHDTCFDFPPPTPDTRLTQQMVTKPPLSVSVRSAGDSSMSSPNLRT